MFQNTESYGDTLHGLSLNFAWAGNRIHYNREKYLFRETLTLILIFPELAKNCEIKNRMIKY